MASLCSCVLRIRIKLPCVKASEMHSCHNFVDKTFKSWVLYEKAKALTCCYFLRLGLSNSGSLSRCVGETTDQPRPTTRGPIIVTTEGPETETSPGPITSLGSADITTAGPSGMCLCGVNEMLMFLKVLFQQLESSFLHTEIYFGWSEKCKEAAVKPALSDHRFKRPPAFSDRVFMHRVSASQNDLY